jgi:hypothetical protein
MPVGKQAQPSRQNLLRVWLIRSIVIAALLAATFWFRFYATVSLPWLPLFLILSVMVLLNGLIFYRLRFDWPVSETEFFANLLLDVVFLTAVLEQQIERCDSILRELVSTSSEDSRMIVTTAGELLDKLQDKWSLVRPEVKLDVHIPGNVSKLEIRYDQSLQHALMSFLNNGRTPVM